MLKFIAAFTSMIRNLHLALGLCLMAAAFWTMPKDEAFKFVPLITFGIAIAHREMTEALDVLRSFAKRRAARHWPAAVAQAGRAIAASFGQPARRRTSMRRPEAGSGHW